MADIPKIVLPHGGYRKLTSFKKSEVVYQMTVVFCRRFLPARGDRTVDQMTQAARSCKQNIAEGSASSGTSKETELKLIKHFETDFTQHGGIRERMHAARTAVRSEDWDKSVYSRLDAAATAGELAARAAEIKRMVDRTVWGIKKRKGWR